MIWMVVLTYLNWNYSSHLLNADMSAELVLGKELSKTGTIFSTDWYYSTECFPIFTQIVSMFLFPWIATWSKVRALMNLCFYVAMVASYLYLARGLKVKPWASYLSSLWLMVPMSTEYLSIIHVGNHYMVHLIMVFLGLGLWIRLLHWKDLTKSKGIILGICWILLSLYAGLCGLRFLTIYGLPMALTGILYAVVENSKGRESLFSLDTWKKPGMYLSLLGCIFTFLGYLGKMHILSRFVYFGPFNDPVMNSQDARSFGDMFIHVMVSTLRLFGYYDESKVASLRGIASLSGIVIFVALCCMGILLGKRYHLWDENRRMMFLFILMSLFVNGFLFLFVAGTYVPRFYIPTMSLFALWIAWMLEDFTGGWKSARDRHMDFTICVVGLLYICMNLSSISACNDLVKYDVSEPVKGVAEFLMENGYDFGLATFWHTETMNEVSNGAIEIVSIKSDDIHQVDRWLTFKKYEYARTWLEFPSYRLFILLDGSEYEKYQSDEMIQAGELVYDEGGLVVLSYDKLTFMKTYAASYLVDR
ncbi:MAG: hypothetical protein K6C69_02900 [Lachnospiraceae bacterium]|nr:hypothetical protein [Lachnospiraceae bacterium]